MSVPKWRDGLLRAVYRYLSSQPEPHVLNLHAARRVVNHTQAARTLAMDAVWQLIDGDSEGADELRTEILAAVDEWEKDGGAA